MDNFTQQTVTVAPSDTYLGDLTGGYSVAAYKVSAIIPPLKSYVGDMSLLSAEGSFSTTLGNKFIYNLQGKSTLKLLNLIDIAEIEMKIGQFTHTDALLGMDEESVTGFVYSKQEGFKADIHNFYLEIFGGYEIDIITKRFMGVRYNGKAEIGVDWWLFDPHYNTDGAVTCGFFRDNNNMLQFTLRASWTENGKRKGILAYIREDGKTEFDSKAKF